MHEHNHLGLNQWEVVSRPNPRIYITSRYMKNAGFLPSGLIYGVVVKRFPVCKHLESTWMGHADDFTRCTDDLSLYRLTISLV